MLRLSSVGSLCKLPLNYRSRGWGFNQVPLRLRASETSSQLGEFRLFGPLPEDKYGSPLGNEPQLGPNLTAIWSPKVKVV